MLRQDPIRQITGLRDGQPLQMRFMLLQQFLKGFQDVIRQFYRIAIGAQHQHDFVLPGHAHLAFADMTASHLKAGFDLGRGQSLVDSIIRQAGAC